MTAPVPPQPEPVICARPGCPATFTPRSKTHKFCSDTCKSRFFAWRHVLAPKRR
jgi:hypothetical protein